jgi:DNA replication protein DnaC
MATVKTPEPAHLVADLKTLCLTSLAKEWERFAQTARAKRQPHQDFLADAAAFEVTQRRERRIQRRLQEARFPVLKTLDGFDFKAPHSLDRDEVLDLFACDFIDQAANVVLIGGVGTGKTHLAIALGMACVQKDRRVRFTTAAELCNLLVEAKRDGRLSRKLDQMARYDVVVLDELGYVVTTNLPFAKWSQVFGDATAAAAVIDRIVHHATVLQTKGASYRLKDAKAKRPRRRRKEVTRS